MHGNSAATSRGSNGNYYDLSIWSNIKVVGDVSDSRARIVRIVHMSDTHDRHGDYMSRIPHGDILVHSGDFSNYTLSRHFFKDRDFHRQIDALNAFFNSLPHTYKIFVAGNHDLGFDNYSPEYIQSKLTSAIYLQDSSCRVLGLNFYGLPWSRWRVNSWARNFTTDWSNLQQRWSDIPSSTDVLISHIPPWNSPLFHIVTKTVKPTLHLFGHQHNGYGVTLKDKVVFCNGAMAQSELSPARSNGSTIQTYGNGSGSGGSSNSYANTTVQKRNPILLDYYVVSDDYECSLPLYHPLKITTLHDSNSRTDEQDATDYQFQKINGEKKCSKITLAGLDSSNGHKTSPSKCSRQLTRSGVSRCTIS